jgi:hypothetical protein
MASVARGVGPDRGALAEILTALESDERALSDCTRVITTALLVRSERAPRVRGLWNLVEAALQSESGLVLLPGIALAAVEGEERRAQAVARWNNYQQALVSLAPEHQEDLLRLARELGQRMRGTFGGAPEGDGPAATEPAPC